MTTKKLSWTRKAAYGLPAFEQVPALATRAWTPSPALLARVTDLVPQEPDQARTFLADPAKVAQLRRALADLPRNQWGTVESEAAFTERVRQDLAASRDLIAAHLGGKRAALAWPWGAYSPQAFQAAHDLGYRTFFTTSVGVNAPGSADHVHRFKARAKSGRWLVGRLGLYARPRLARAYARLRR